MDLDVKVKATVLGAAFLIVSIDLIIYQLRTQGLISAPCHPATPPRSWLGTRLIYYYIRYEVGIL